MIEIDNVFSCLVQTPWGAPIGLIYKSGENAKKTQILWQLKCLYGWHGGGTIC